MRVVRMLARVSLLVHKWETSCHKALMMSHSLTAPNGEDGDKTPSRT